MMTASAAAYRATCGYRPPNADRIWMENFSNFINDVCSRRSKIIRAGDFNLRRARWNACENLSGVNENTFVRMLDDHFLEQITGSPKSGCTCCHHNMYMYNIIC